MNCDDEQNRASALKMVEFNLSKLGGVSCRIADEVSYVFRP